MRPTLLLSPRAARRTALWERPPFRRRRSPYDDDEGFLEDDIDDEGAEEFYQQEQQPRGRSERTPRNDLDYYDDDDEEGIADDPYARYDEDGDDDEYFYEQDIDNSYVTPVPRVEWEEIEVPNQRSTPDDDDSYSTVYVLLPPSPPTMHPLPSAVLHFVGGTLFGSAPKVWYRSLLEDIVTSTQCAIVVTPLPVITPFNSKQMRGPLHHVSMAKRLQYQFQYAYETVLEDEYGMDAMKGIPIAGFGHSLGSRLLVVLATLMKDSRPSNEAETDEAPRRRQRSKRTLEYKAMILASFTNYGAAAGIPGISSLLKYRTKLDQKANGQQQATSSRDRSSPRRQSRQRRNTDWYDDDFDDDEDEEDLLEELSELWVGMKGAFQTQADRVKTVLTPQAEDLEFYPTPRALWKALEGNRETGEGSRYRIPQTLLIQFDQDDMDQSSKLASVLISNRRPSADTMATSKATSADDKDGTETTATAIPPVTTTDLKFARLRGTHLTPISTSTSKEEDLDRFRRRNKGMLQQWSSRSTKALWKVIQGRVTGGSIQGMTQEEALRDLRQSITRYIADVVTK